MHELIVNMHMHTTYSDGHGSHADIAQAALRNNLDAAIVTDHNVLVNGMDAVYKNGNQRTMLLVGEEIHDQAREPQKNHVLVFGANRELAPLAYDTQQLLDAARHAGGVSFLAHPTDPAAPAFNEPDISWVDWDVKGYTGIELWNGMSEFKSLLKSKLHAVYYAYNPRRVARGPFPESIQQWDNLLANGRRVAAIGGSDAHAIPASLGPLKRTLFPYDFHFRAINTHLFTPSPLTGDLTEDRQKILDSFKKGCAFIGYDLPAPTRGFRFTASGKNHIAWMGDELSAVQGITFQIRLPRPTVCRLINNGKVVKSWHNRENCTYITAEPGAYRVEVFLQYLGRLRGWIFSNPIYVH